jgi:hypothetical protein
VVERWTENCAMCGEPSRQALGRHLKEMWHAELERQNAIAQSKPHLSNKWKPPVWPDAHRFHCDDGPIGFALDMITRWQRQLQFVIRFLHAMEATVTYSPRERWDADGVTNTSQAPAPPANKRGSGSRAAQAPTHFTTGGRSSNQPPRAQNKRPAGPPAPSRQEERPAAKDSQHAPRAALEGVGCEGCGRKGHTAER